MPSHREPFYRLYEARKQCVGRQRQSFISNYGGRINQQVSWAGDYTGMRAGALPMRAANHNPTANIGKEQ